MEFKVDHPHFPKGFEFELPGVGVVANGDTITVDDEQAAMYEAATGKKFEQPKKSRSKKKKDDGTDETSDGEEGGDN